ncbi:rho GTPase-activating protein 18 isoform X2 [Petromyzon marinus]|uniref:Rho GTPase-activating protein 18-like n=2 Tax=Petromyzon marinus TaxID=7757 RepID=A0AAJ7X1N8_PETMA|nr:rho GTPase-activating protein 18-like [Petromyzon marinus]
METPTAPSLVVLKSYHVRDPPDSAAADRDVMTPASRRSVSPARPSFDRSSSQDSLDELSERDFWTEVHDIKESRGNDEALIKPADEEEQQADWLHETGLSTLVVQQQQAGGAAAEGPGSCADDGGAAAAAEEERALDAEALLATLTRTQAAAAIRRINTYTQTMRRKNKQTVRDVRDIFGSNVDTDGMGMSCMQPSSQDELSDDDSAAAAAAALQRERSRNSVVSETDIICDVPYSEEASQGRHKHRGNAAAAGTPNATTVTTTATAAATAVTAMLLQHQLGVTRIGDLSPEDMRKVHRVALIELAAFFDALHIDFTRNRPVKVRAKDSRLFGVPLSTLLEQDQKISPGVKVPLFLQELLTHLEQTGLDTEGIFRIPGSSSRIKSLRQELEAGFYDGAVTWDDVRPHDAASLLKLFIRELPAPLLTAEYLTAFTSVEKIEIRKQRIRALNLLIILLPAANRDVLKAILELLLKVSEASTATRMDLWNVSLIMAPNLFMSSGSALLQPLNRQFAAAYAGLVRMLIKDQRKLWIIPPFLLRQVRELNDANKRQPQKERGVRRFLRITRIDKDKKPERREVEPLSYTIRVAAPLLSKLPMAVQLDEGVRAGDLVARFFADSEGGKIVEHQEYCLHEIGGNIGDRCLDAETHMRALYEANPHADWVIKPKASA